MRIVAGIRNSHPHLSCLAVTLLCFKAFSPFRLNREPENRFPVLFVKIDQQQLCIKFCKLTYPERFVLVRLQTHLESQLILCFLQSILCGSTALCDIDDCRSNQAAAAVMIIVLLNDRNMRAHFNDVCVDRLTVEVCRTGLRRCSM